MGSIDYAQLALRFIPIILAITFHEAAHGFAALQFGDDTAKNAGRLTLNPLKHIDLLGTIIMPVFLYLSAGFVFGYAKPVPVNFHKLNRPRLGMAVVALAGPAMNILLALISALIVIFGVSKLSGETAAWIGNMLVVSVEMNFVLALFNMLPIPPLDGSKVLAAFLPGVIARPYLRLARYGMLIILLLLMIAPVIATNTSVHINIFGPLVVRPAEYLTQLVLSPILGE